MQLILEAHDTLFRVWELAVSFLGLPLLPARRALSDEFAGVGREIPDQHHLRVVSNLTVFSVVAASAVLLGAVGSARAADQWFVMGQQTLNATDPSAEIKTEGSRWKKDVKQVRLAVEGADVQMIKVVLGSLLSRRALFCDPLFVGFR